MNSERNPLERYPDEALWDDERPLVNRDRLSLEEVIAAAASNGEMPYEMCDADARSIAKGVREWLLADPQIERGARGSYESSPLMFRHETGAVVPKPWERLASHDHYEVRTRAALSAILESPNREERA